MECPLEEVWADSHCGAASWAMIGMTLPLFGKNAFLSSLPKAVSSRESVNSGALNYFVPLLVIQHYGVCHEDAVWQVRQEPGVMGAFEKVCHDILSSLRKPTLILLSATSGLRHRRPYCIV